MKGYKMMKRKILTISLSFVIFISFSSLAFAQDTDTNNSITDSTIITSENIYDVVDYLGLNPEDVTFYDSEKYPNVDVTVGEFKAIILQAEETLKDVQTQSDDVYQSSNTFNASDSILRMSGNKTVSKKVDYSSSCQVKYSVSGDYYSDDFDIRNRFWHRCTDWDMEITKSYTIYFYEIDDVYEKNAYAVNANTNNSYIQFDYDYDIGAYLGIGDFAVKYHSFNVDGYTRFGGQQYI